MRQLGIAAITRPPDSTLAPLLRGLIAVKEWIKLYQNSNYVEVCKVMTRLEAVAIEGSIFLPTLPALSTAPSVATLHDNTTRPAPVVQAGPRQRQLLRRQLWSTGHAGADLSVGTSRYARCLPANVGCNA